MSDIATIWDPASSWGDWAVPTASLGVLTDEAGRPLLGPDGFAVTATRPGPLPGAGLRADQDLQTAALISIFTDATASRDDAIPDGSGDPRGWWGDPAIGSRLWLRMRSKQTLQALALVKADIKAALAWMIDDGVAASIDIGAAWDQAGRLACEILIRRQNGTTVAVAFDWAWKEL